MATLIKEVRLVFSDVDENKNKFWHGCLYDDGSMTAHWGRVGYDGEKGEWTNKNFDKLVESKLKKGYTYQRTVGAAIASDGGSQVKDNELHTIAKTQLIKTSNPTLERLIKRLVDANVHRITTSTQITYSDTTGLFSTPLGIVTPDGLVEARDLLDKIAPYIRQGKYENGVNPLVSQYLRIIPQNMGMRLAVRNLFPDESSIQKQNDLIDALESSYQALQTQKPTEPKDTTVKPQEKVFEVDLDILSDDRERSRIVKWFENTKKKNHNYDSVRVREIFRVTLHDMVKSFDVSKKPVKEVWHGTSQANCLSILKSGLKVSPPRTARIAGKLFGNGIYGAFNSTKSLGYTFGRWGQGGVGDAGWLFVCEFAMGKTYETTAYGCNCPKGYDSIWAKSSGGGLYNDEVIVYSNPQVNIKYLLECK